MPDSGVAPTGSALIFPILGVFLSNVWMTRDEHSPLRSLFLY